ncbi:unnamed protein product [Chironomus riparius]|uniref:MD-2-related lipid-recognition domain-containing protein n=1 Tax=Chironomus riparius TaxID=315576 RepID=A0A9N9S539_9DIPT|nr:unnamed protein product [Chironomus riparius]
MAKLISFMILCCISTFIDAQTVTKQCRGFRKLDTTEVSLSNCQKGICKFPRGKTVEVVLKFTPDREIKSLTTNVEANINNIQLPWIGVDGASACNSIFNENGEKVSCPLQAGQRYVYKNRFDVLTIYPRIQTIVHWALKAGRHDLICFEVPVRIV